MQELRVCRAPIVGDVTRLQEEKQKESMEREIQRDKERIREKELIAKPASS